MEGLLLQLLVVLILVIVGVAAAFRARKWANSEDSSQATFTLQDLREMRDRGDITEVEFQTMRGEILGQFADSKIETKQADLPQDPFAN
jgi:uncharacterized membrane protein